MNLRFLPLLLILHLNAPAQKPTKEALPGFANFQTANPGHMKFPSPEQFVNAIAPAVVDSGLDHYYLVAGTDSCRFLKYNYDEWVKYHLTEPVPFQVLNDLAEKVYLSRYPYFWKQTRLRKAVCVTRQEADRILAAGKDYIYSLSLPQFTDDGQYAVIDLNLVCGPRCGKGVTCIFQLTARGEWKIVGENTNWEYH